MCERIDRCTCLVEPSCSLSHSCFTHVWHHHDCSSWISGLCLHFGFVHPPFEIRTETGLHLLRLLILLHLLSPHAPGDLGNLIDDLHRGTFTIFCSLDVRNIFVCTFGSSEPVFGCWICSSCTTGTSAVLSVNFHSFLCLLRCWHLHQDCDFLHSVKEWNMWLSLCFLRGSNWWELGGCDVPQLAHQRTCHCTVLWHLRLLKPVGTCLCTFTDVDNFVDELHFDNLHVFFGGDGSDRWNLPLYHHCRLICP